MIVFEPNYQVRVWGGRLLESALGRSLPDEQPYGESWELVDREEAQSSCLVNGVRRTLRELIVTDPEGIMGAGWLPEWRFPILVKWLDCRERLSLQVHPPASVAALFDGEPKTEAWYIAAAEPGAAVLAGLKQGVTRAQFEQALLAGALEPLVHRSEVTPGDFLFVPSGRIHAIDAGNLILEIQQNSDTTYRVYDWGRLGLDGQPRQLHVKRSLASIDFNDYAPEPIKATHGEQLLADCPEFRLRKLSLEAGDTLELAAKEQPRILSIVSGSLTVNGEPLLAGANALLPFRDAATLQVTSKTVLLITDSFHIQ